MDECPVLPATGSTVTVIFVASAILVALGVTTLLLVRRRAMPMLAIVLVAGVVGIGAPGSCPATGCPPASTAATAATTAPTVAPASTSTTTPVAVAPGPPSTSTTTSTTTTSTSTTTPTTAPPGIPPNAENDDENVVGGQFFSFNVLTNDFLGSPPATITDSSLTAATCGGVTFNEATGILSGTLEIQPAFLACILAYELTNSAGFDTASATFTAFPASS